MSDFGSLALAFGGLATVILILLALLWGLHKLFVLIWIRLPLAIIEAEGRQIGRFFGIIVALIMVPRVAIYAVQIVRNLADFAGGLVGRISARLLTPSSACNEEGGNCVGEVVRTIGSTLGEVSFQLVSAFNLNNFPTVDFIQFLLIALVVTLVIDAIVAAMSDGSIGGWWERFNSAVPSATRSRIVFATLVLVSSYLALSAVLAVSFFQNRVQSQQYSVDALEKILAGYVIPATEFEKQFPEHLPALSVIGAPTNTPAEAALVVRFLADEQKRQAGNYERLQIGWTSLRASAAALPGDLRDAAVGKFRGATEGRVGSRETAEYFSDIVQWHQRGSRDARDALRSCWGLATQFATESNRAYSELGGNIVRVAGSGAAASQAYGALISDFLASSNLSRAISESFGSAVRGCRQIIAVDQTEMPERKPFGSWLGLIGRWAGWLLQSEAMPVVIVVGLVGFSLLGATVSRVVRQSLEGPGTQLTLDDLLFVIAGGTTSAFVVFLAAYGGLAVLGGGASTSDPNPYVVFVTCLVAAVYSELVWRWARRRILAPLDEKEAGGQPSNGTPPRDETQIPTPAQAPTGAGQTPSHGAQPLPTS